MAMVVCPECGRDISDKAAWCMGCGAPVPSPWWYRTGMKHGPGEGLFLRVLNEITQFIWIVVVFAVFAFFWFAGQQ